MRLSFGECVLDTDRHVLERGGKPVHLSPKGLAVLQLLIKQSPSAVSKQELLDQIWPDVVVEEQNVKSVIFEIRQTLGADAAAIRTVQRFGYAFAGEVAQPATRAWLVSSNRTYALAPGINTIGRAPSSSIVVEAMGVSRRHARILIAGDRASLEDAGSKNGTWRNGERITTPVDLHEKDAIRIGAAELTFVVTSAGTSTSTML